MWLLKTTPLATSTLNDERVSLEDYARAIIFFERLTGGGRWEDRVSHKE